MANEDRYGFGGADKGCDGSIIGLSYGLTVPFALTAGLSSIGIIQTRRDWWSGGSYRGCDSMGLGGYRKRTNSMDVIPVLTDFPPFNGLPSRARSLPLPSQANTS